MKPKPSKDHRRAQSDQISSKKKVLKEREYDSKHVRSNGTGPSHVRSVFILDMTTADGTFSAGNFKIAPEDTILVTESPIASVRTVMGLVGAAFGLSNAASN